jgi:hypothetical protein
MVTEKLVDADGNPMDLHSTDVELAYRTNGMTAMRASCKSGEYTNCYIDEDDSSILHVIFHNHHLGIGRLTREISVNIDNPHFEHDMENIRFKDYVDTIVLVEFGGSIDNRIVIDTKVS